MSERDSLSDLFRTPGKAELVAGRIVRYPPDGVRPSRVAGRITRSLDEYGERCGRGFAYTSTIMFAVPELASGRQSFSPDASYYAGPPPANPMSYIEGTPTFAAEVRSEDDYGEAAEDAIALKRVDYFEAGTLVVWDVDPVNELIRAYRASEPDAFTVYRRGDVAEAEPAVPGWRVPVDWIFS